jgi:hypothetical protein
LIGVLLVAALLVGAGWQRSRAANDPVLLGAGDIADCDSPGAEITARLVEKIPGTVYTLGDNAYPEGTLEQFNECYAPTWGRFKDRTRPSPGNHEYATPGAADYFEYFGAAAGIPGQGYYSYDLGTWHIIVLNSACDEIGGCDAGSRQEQWLAADLAAHPNKCTLAYWHHPLFGSSGDHSRNLMMQPIWWTLYRAGVDVILNGHAHNYERLMPVDPKGVPDPRRGIRQFIVGSGGRDHRTTGKILSISEVQNSDTYGVLKLTLHPNSYDWQFVPEPGKAFTDSGNASCH